MSNVISFAAARNRSKAGREPEDRTATSYDFNAEELAQLCRWYSAMKYAFPQAQGVMTLCHSRRLSAIGLYGEDGAPPHCLLTKHEQHGSILLLWATDQDPPQRIGSLREITERQIGAIAPPANESSWLDLPGWSAILTARTILGSLHAG
jgi:hypothetical protein